MDLTATTRTAVSRAHLLLLLAMIGVAAALVWVAWSARQIVLEPVPQAVASLNARVEFGEAYVALEHRLDSEATAASSVDEAFGSLGEVRWFLHALLEGGWRGADAIVAVDDAAVRERTQQALVMLDEFETLARQHLEAERSGMPDGARAERMHEVYGQFLAIMNGIEEILQAETQRQLQIFLMVQAVLISLALLVFGAVIRMLRRQERLDRDAHLGSLRESYAQLERAQHELQSQNRIRGALVELGDRLQGLGSVAAAAQVALDVLCERCEAQAGICWGYRPGRGLERLAAHALPEAFASLTMLAEGEGLAGRVARDRLPLAIDVPSDYFVIASGTGQASAPHLRILPVVHDGRTVAVLEFAFFREPTADAMALLEVAVPAIAIRLHMLGRSVDATDVWGAALST